MPGKDTVPRQAEITRIRAEVLQLAPWYYDVEVAHGVRTGEFLDAPEAPGATEITVEVRQPQGHHVNRKAFVPSRNLDGAQPVVSLQDPREDALRTLTAIFPAGLEGRSVLDCPCNAGVYTLWAKELGAGPCRGFDAREHWIRQARFLAREKGLLQDEVRFEVANLYELPQRGLEPFDVTFFNGILYHLPDPIRGMQIAADLTRELLILDTAARRGVSEPALVATKQGRDRIDAGFYGLRWLPTSPALLFRVLRWLGFAEMRCTWWRPRAPLRDRVEVVAARSRGFFDAYDAGLGEGAERFCNVVSTGVPPDVDVLVASGGDDALLALDGRRAWHFRPRSEADAAEVVRRLERLRAQGADYLALPLGRPHGLERVAGLEEALAKRFPLVLRDRVCRVFELTEAERPAFAPGSET